MNGYFYRGEPVERWQWLATRRHENEAVLQAVDNGADDRESIARMTGLGLFQTEIVIRRLILSRRLERIDGADH